MNAPTPTLWLARCGEGGFALTDCVDAGVVALRYRTVGDATDLTLDEISEGVYKAGTRTNLKAVARMLDDFVRTAAVGDLVVTTHLATRTVYFGQITGEYEFRDPSPVPGFLHLRPVEWWGSLDRDTDVPASHLVDIDRQPTFYRLPSQAYWLDQARTVKDADAEVVAPERSTAPGKPTVAKAPPPSAMPMCTSCGLPSSASAMESGVCAYCR